MRANDRVLEVLYRQERDEARDALEQAIAALKVAHHALTTVHGLWATDLKPGIEDVGGFFRIDKLKALAAIEKVLDED